MTSMLEPCCWILLVDMIVIHILNKMYSVNKECSVLFKEVFLVIVLRQSF